MPSSTDQILQLVFDAAKSLLLNQLNQATSAQVSGVSSFAQQVANEQLARDQQTYNLLIGLSQQLRQVDADISNLVSLCQQSNRPVMLPSTPPAGYGGLSSSATGDAVWLYSTGFPSGNALGALSEIRYKAVQEDVAGVAFPATEAEDWWVSGPFYNSTFAPDPPGNTFTLDFTTILPSDATANAWVRRVYPGFSWELPVRGICVLLGADGFFYSLPWLTQDRFNAIKTALFPTTAVQAPVWPGIANVTLGASLALADGLNVPGPLDGVLVTITSVSYPISFYPFGTLKSFVKVGGIVFVDDNGQGEMAQPLGLEADVVCPRTMVQADHALLRLQSGVVGTIRPWVRS